MWFLNLQTNQYPKSLEDPKRGVYASEVSVHPGGVYASEVSVHPGGVYAYEVSVPKME